VFALIRWTNDTFVSEVPVVTAILVVMGLVGESPILTRHIDEQLRGLVVALFMPVFFSLAGLRADLSVLGNPQLFLLAFGLIASRMLGPASARRKLAPADRVKASPTPIDLHQGMSRCPI
jgi:hypothetical protein